ncbi:Homeobox-leucine zipper protein HOX29 [Hibiscus syriacus]|uniref:Homeobox-leucine zipper protein HOX29 n=1 Tax=Hibiscus syriacus TaxID=106335 RepID=A0A6A3CWN2_HIBSY|nr:Homeobox-leucine zipper protein HOX29 [Hibiscus syriacus]
MLISAFYVQPGPDSIGIVAISHGRSGVAARACGLVAEILKDRPSWYHDCRAVAVINMLSTGNGGTIELLYMQLYAPTTLAPARDFWLLRHTSVLEDGSLVICERSLNNTQNGPSMPPAFITWIWSLGVRPLYESSTLLAQKTTMAALRHLKQISQEISQPNVTGWGRKPAALRALSQKLYKGFNESVNGFTDEGWSMLESDGVDDVTLLVNSSPGKMMGINLSYGNGFPSMSNAVICAKASVLLQNVPPVILLRFLREHRSEWADSGIDAYSAAAVNPCGLPVVRGGSFGGQVILPLAHTIENEEFMEVIKLENMGHYREDMIMPNDIFLLQVLKFSPTIPQLIFVVELIRMQLALVLNSSLSPLMLSFSAGVPIIPSGFHIISLDSGMDASSPDRTLDLASTLEVGAAANRPTGVNSSRYRSTNVIASVQRVELALSPSHLGSPAGFQTPPGTPEAQALAHWNSQSHRCYLGVELLEYEGSESILKTLWHHSDAVLCCSLEALSVFTFANQAGLDMLETTLVALQDITLEKIFDDNTKSSICGVPTSDAAGFYVPSRWYLLVKHGETNFL